MTAVPPPGPSGPPPPGPPPAPGRLLVAAPILMGSRFERSVVLLLAHDEDGTVGVVLTSPASLDIEDIAPGWSAAPGDRRVHVGGPVQPDGALAVAHRGRLSGTAPAFRPFAEPLGAVDLDADPEGVAPYLGRLRVFVGYAGWSPGQLADELAEGAWFVVPGHVDDAFTAAPEGLWRAVLARQRVPLAWLATYPDDATSN